MVILRPGDDPYRELARVLCEVLSTISCPSDLDEWRSYVRAMLLSGDNGLIRVVNEAGLPPESNLQKSLICAMIVRTRNVGHLPPPASCQATVSRFPSALVWLLRQGHGLIA